MVAQAGKIVKANYNDIRNSVDFYLGAGSGQYGYGQSLNTPASVGTTDKIRQTHWAGLKTDILRIAAHQGLAQNSGWTTGVTDSIPVLPTASGKISASLTNAYANAMTALASNPWRMGEYSDEIIISTDRVDNWNATIRHFATIDLSSSANARYFFNAGGYVYLYPLFTKSVTDSINNDWENLINTIGYVYMGYTSTFSSTGNGTGSSIGFYDLTNSNQLIYSKGASTYTSNDYLVYARCDVANNASGGARYIYFEIYFRDNKVQTGFGFQSGPQYDEVVQGIVYSGIRMLRPSGSNVAVTGISGTNTVNLYDAQV
jgi:hypothetical protein